MAVNDDAQGTLEQVDVTGQESAESGYSGESSENDDFLVVNDRVKYATREDAIKAYQESGNRIEQLSVWEKELKDYGITDPKVVRQLLNELVQRRNDAEKAEKQAKEAAGDGKGKQTTRSDDSDELSKEDQAALKWLQKMAPRLGYVPKDELQKTVEELKGQITELQAGTQAAQEERRSSLIDSGRQNVSQWLSDDKIADPDGNKRHVIETLVTAWINQDDERVNKFYQGGSVTKELLKEGYDLAKKSLGWTGAQPDATSRAADKGRAIQRNKSLPKPGTSGKAGQQTDGVRRDAAGRRDHIGSAHNAAWEIANKHFHNAE